MHAPPSPPPIGAVPDISGGGGWLVSESRWEQLLDNRPPATSIKLLGGSVLLCEEGLPCREGGPPPHPTLPLPLPARPLPAVAALQAHPELGLEEYNLAPTLTYSKLPHALLRTGVSPPEPTPGTAAHVVDGAVTSAPFTSLARLSTMAPVLGLASVRHHVLRAVAALKASGVAPVPVSVPLALVTDDADTEPELRPMLFIPDLVLEAPAETAEGGADAAAAGAEVPAPGGGGWIMSEDRYEGRLDRSGLVQGGEGVEGDVGAVEAAAEEAAAATSTGQTEAAV